MKQRLFVISWAVITIGLIIYTVVIQENSKRVIGITEVEETTVSFPFPVEVSSVPVVPNQKINQGDLLLELRSEELEQDIRKLRIQVENSRQSISEARQIYLGKVEKLKREQVLEVNSLKSELEDTRIALVNDLAISSSLNLEIADSIMNPKQIKLQNLEKEIQLTESYYTQLIRVAQIEFDTEQSSINRSLENLEYRLGDQLKNLESLNVLALYDGYVKRVRVEKKTLMEAFTPLITYSKLTPVFVRAYTDEQTRLEVNLGSTVTISSASRKWISTEGVIIAESKRITELPDRLKIQPYSQEWGQEFLVKLPANNDFLIGEKVLIK